MDETKPELNQEIDLETEKIEPSASLRSRYAQIHLKSEGEKLLLILPKTSASTTKSQHFREKFPTLALALETRLHSMSSMIEVLLPCRYHSWRESQVRKTK